MSHQEKKRKDFFYRKQQLTTVQSFQLFLTNFKHIEYTNGFFLANPKTSLKFSSFLTSPQDLTLLNLLLFLECFIPVASTIASPPHISYYNSGCLFHSLLTASLPMSTTKIMGSLWFAQLSPLHSSIWHKSFYFFWDFKKIFFVFFLRFIKVYLTNNSIYI